MNPIKNKFKRIYIGLYEGYKISIVPQFLIDFESKLHVKLLKLLGGIATASIITGIASNYNKIVFYSAVLISFPYLLYRLAYIFFVTKELYKIVKDKRYQVRNLPVDNLTTIFKGVFIAAKTIGKYSVGAGTGYSLAHLLDYILADEGGQRVFVPAIQKGLDQLGITNGIVSVLDRFGLTKPKEGVDNSIIKKAASELGVSDRELLEGVK